MKAPSEQIYGKSTQIHVNLFYRIVS